MSLNKKKLEMHLAKVYAARVDLEYKLAQREAEIENIKRNIQLQIDEESRLKKSLETQGE